MFEYDAIGVVQLFRY